MVSSDKVGALQHISQTYAMRFITGSWSNQGKTLILLFSNMESQLTLVSDEGITCQLKSLQQNEIGFHRCWFLPKSYYTTIRKHILKITKGVKLARLSPCTRSYKIGMNPRRRVIREKHRRPILVWRYQMFLGTQKSVSQRYDWPRKKIAWLFSYNRR